MEARYWCPSKGNGGCSGVAKPAWPVEEYSRGRHVLRPPGLGAGGLSLNPPVRPRRPVPNAPPPTPPAPAASTWGRSCTPG